MSDPQLAGKDLSKMGIGEVYELIREDLRGVEEEFKRHLRSRVYLISKVGEYILMSGGKRFRPSLLILSSRLCGYRGRDCITLGSIIEFVHTATLLHDDVVDNAQLRRGKASANVVWGNGASVLVGDFLFSKSFYLLVASEDLEILKVMSRTTTQMAEGEVLQLLKCNDVETTQEEYISVIVNKTASLISAACEIGAILGGARDEERKALSSFGLNLGIAFQLMDDCLDYTSKNEELGKAIGNDLKEGKVTLPLIHTLRRCSREEREVIVRAVEGDELTEEHFEEVMSLIKRYKGIEFTRDLALEYIQKAKEALKVFAPSIYHTALCTVADYVVERRY